MPIENRIKDTPNMSLHLMTEHNPYIVSMQGLLITKAPDETGAKVLEMQPKAVEKDQLQKPVSYVAAFYLPRDFKFIEPYLDMTDPIIRLLIPLCMLGIFPKFKPTHIEFRNYLIHQDRVGRKSTALDKLKKDFQEHAAEELMKDVRKANAELIRALGKPGAEEESAPGAAATSATEEGGKEDKNDDDTKGWTCKLNRKSSISYDAVHVIFTHKNFANENFYLFINKKAVDMNKKYLFVYCGRMEDFCLQISSTSQLPSADEEAIYVGLKQEMDDLYEKTKPDQDGVSYYECEETTDDGYWHDSARRILIETTHANTTAMNKFVHAIAKRLFKVEYESHKKFTYNFKPDLHKFALDDEFHVIVRLQGGKPLIFFCSKDNQPNNCISCTKEHALGSSSVPTQSPARPNSAQSSRSARISRSAPSGVYDISNADRAVLLAKANERIQFLRAKGNPQLLRQLQAAPKKPENPDPFPDVRGTRV